MYLSWLFSPHSPWSVHKHQVHWVTVLEESGTTSEPGLGPSYTTITTTIPIPDSVCDRRDSICHQSCPSLFDVNVTLMSWHDSDLTLTQCDYISTRGLWSSCVCVCVCVTHTHITSYIYIHTHIISYIYIYIYIWKKKIHDLWESCLRVGFFTPVRGRKGRWGACPPDWDGWSGSPDPLSGYTSGCVWCGKLLVVVPAWWQGGFEKRVLDDTNTWSLIRPGHESSVRSEQLIRRWGLTRESAPGSEHWW
jgi:hypothetical protein